MSRPGRLRAAGFSLAAFLLFFGLAECGLRAVGFRFEPAVGYMRFNFPNPNELYNVFEPDPARLWRMRPGFDFGQGFEPLNGHGFRGPWFGDEKRSGTIRVACLGDSVTFGRPDASYPAMLGEALETAAGSSVEAVNLGVPGYTTWQGKHVLDDVLWGHSPDIVIILFGWNDHWLAMGHADKDQVVGGGGPPAVASPLGKSRVYQALLRTVAEGRALASPPERVLRVSPEDYRSNLEAMVEACEKAGARPVLATAVSAIDTGEVPDFLTHLNFIEEGTDLAELHGKYNDIVRDVARDKGVLLIDLDRGFEGRDSRALFEDPAKDLVHPNRAGYEVMVGLMASALAKEIGSSGGTRPEGASED